MNNTRIDPETGEELIRGTRKMILTYKDLTMTIDMPGWYKDGSEKGIHSGDDMKISDRALNRLKAQVAALLTEDRAKAKGSR